jgi:phosphate transport system substrate-binding protein
MKNSPFVVTLAMLATLCATPLRAAPLNGEIHLDGSSTVFPLSEAVAEEFGAIEKSVRVTVGTSGTGGGFKKFCAGEIDINDASRMIKTSELEECKKKQIQFIELAVATDGLTVVVHPSNQFAKSLTKAELKKIWEPGTTVKLWSDINSSWPKEKITLFGPGPDSGTFDYFTEEIVGKAKSSRADYTASEDDNVLLKGIAASKFALGYFGHGYYMANKNKVRALGIDAGKGAIDPTDANVMNGSYPLSRQLYIYVNAASAKKQHILAFIKFYLENAKRLSHETGYVPLKDSEYKAMTERLLKQTSGSNKKT